MKPIQRIPQLRALLTSLLATSAVAPAQLAINTYTIDGGGVMNSTGGAFALSGTVGQADAGVMTGGVFTLHGGFWVETAVVASCAGHRRGDANCDGIVNNFDIDPWIAGLVFAAEMDPPASYLSAGASAACWPHRDCWGDANCDHMFNNFDIEPFVNCLVTTGTCAACP